MPSCYEPDIKNFHLYKIMREKGNFKPKTGCVLSFSNQFSASYMSICTYGFACESFAALVTLNLLSKWRPNSMHLLFAMMSKKNFLMLANEVVRRCSNENVIVPVDLCVYLMNFKLLGLSKDPSVYAHDENLTKTLIKECVEYFRKDSLATETLKLQLFWQEKYHSIDEIKKIHHERVFKNILPIMSEIVEDSTIKTMDKDIFSQKIVIFIIMFAGLGSPTQQSIIKETRAALLSIFKTTELDHFLGLPKVMKEQQLIEFSRLITGILLFNKDCKKGGEEMDDLPLILTEGVRATKERLLSFKDQLDQKIDQLVKTLILSYRNSDLKQDNVNYEFSNKISQPLEFREEKLEEFKTLLIYYRHIESCLNDLIKDLEKSFASIEKLVERLQSTLLQVHNVVRYRVAVATIQVFPLFLHLSDIWVEMQEEVDILSEINDTFVDLSLVGKLQLPLPNPLDFFRETDLSSETIEIHDSLDFYPGVKVCSISSLPSHENLQYKGFCAWTLADAEGLLVTGNFTLGVIHYSNRFYTFSSPEVAFKWALNPNHYIEMVIKVAKVKYELIKFLNLENDLIEKLSVREPQKPVKANAQSQTDLHPLESFISRDYTFSEWELKRRIMKIANLSRYATKSQQTAKQSNFRKDTSVQVNLSKNVSTQTTKDGYCYQPGMPRYVRSLGTERYECLHSDSNFDSVRRCNK